jgi:hypothetical protein
LAEMAAWCVEDFADIDISASIFSCHPAHFSQIPAHALIVNRPWCSRSEIRFTFGRPAGFTPGQPRGRAEFFMGWIWTPKLGNWVNTSSRPSVLHEDRYERSPHGLTETGEAGRATMSNDRPGAGRGRLLLGIGLALGVATAAVAQDKIGPDQRFSPDGRPVRVVPIAPGGTPAPVPASPPLEPPTPAAPQAPPIAKAPLPAPVMSAERCASAGMDFDAARAVCRERAPPMDPSAPLEAQEAPQEPRSAFPTPSYSPPAPRPPAPSPVAPSRWPPPGYPAACPWPLPKGWRCTPDGAVRG